MKMTKMVSMIPSWRLWKNLKKLQKLAEKRTKIKNRKRNQKWRELKIRLSYPLTSKLRFLPFKSFTDISTIKLKLHNFRMKEDIHKNIKYINNKLGDENWVPLQINSLIREGMLRVLPVLSLRQGSTKRSVRDFFHWSWSDRRTPTRSCDFKI